MRIIEQSINRPLLPTQRITKANQLLNGASYADFSIKNLDVRISIIWPGLNDRHIHVTDRETGNVSRFKMDPEGNPKSCEFLRRVAVDVCGVKMHRFDPAKPANQLNGDRILMALKEIHRVNRKAA